MPEFDFDGLREATRAAFRPHFAEVVDRAGRRRRRTRAVGAVAAVAVLATGTGVAARLLPHGGGASLGAPTATPTTPNFIPPAAPSDGPSPRSGHHVGTVAMIAGDLDHLYLKYSDCQGGDCAVKVAASGDGGASWATYPLPVPHNALVAMFAPGPRTVLAWVQDDGTAKQHWLASTDAGQAWHAVTVHDTDVIPVGWQPLDAPSSSAAEISVLAADPQTGNLVQLAQPRALNNARVTGDRPPAAGLWVTGYADAEPSLDGSTVDVSRDGGRTWHRETLPEELSANGLDGLGGAAVATYDGQTAYAVGSVAGKLVAYRTVDGGVSWQRAPLAGPAREGIGDRRIHAAVRADGTLTIQVGDQAGDDPVMYQSTDGGQTLTQVPVGPGADAVPTTGGYAQSGWPNSSGVWLSPDGTSWSYVGPPKLP